MITIETFFKDYESFELRLYGRDNNDEMIGRTIDVDDLFHVFLVRMLEDGYITKPRKKAEAKPKSNWNTGLFNSHFWIPYPKKVGKAEAVKAWNKLKPTFEQGVEINNHIHKAYKDKDKQFLPNPASYLNGARWNDEIIEVKKQLIKLPMDDNELESFARDNGLPKPKPADTFFEYRKTLRNEINNNQILA